MMFRGDRLSTDELAIAAFGFWTGWQVAELAIVLLKDARFYSLNF
ncbi:hypothetical protein [Oculatella sp. LEGE 06141]|nr:hypothetical protein [Oculatella sp. LEGE 06141]